MGTKRPAQGELFRNNLQKIWICRAGGASSSMRNVCDPDLIVHFESFLKTSVILHRGCVDSESSNNWFVVQVDPKTWALAFIQWDLKEACVILSEVVFTQQELEARNAALDDTAKLECLNVIKRNAIARAVVWMKSKTQDPWEYEASSNINVSDTDWLEINRGFLKFNKIVPVPQFLLTNVLEDENGMPPGVFKDPQTNGDLCDTLTQKLDSILSLESATEVSSATGLSFEEIFETVWGLVVIERRSMVLRLLDLQNLTTSAQTVKELTLYMIRDLNEVFVGSVQFDRTQFSVLEKRRNAGFAQMVRSLFRMLYRRYNNNSSNSDPQIENSTFRSFRDDKQAAVLLLSIIRILKFLSQFEDKLEDKAKEFDETKHNIFPSKEEMQEVFRVLKGVCPGRFNDEDSGMNGWFNAAVINQSQPLPFEPCIPVSVTEQTTCQLPVPSPMQMSPATGDFSECSASTSTVQNVFNISNGILNQTTSSNQTDFASAGTNPQQVETYVNMSNPHDQSQAQVEETSEFQKSFSEILNESNYPEDWGSFFHPQPPTNTNCNATGTWASSMSATTPMPHSSFNAPPFPETSNVAPQFMGAPLTYESDGTNYNSEQNVVTYQIISPPVMAQPGNSDSNGFRTQQLKYNVTLTPDGKSFVHSVVLMKYPAYGFEVSVLIQAYNMMKAAVERRGSSKSNPAFEAGKEIFRRIFSQDEIDNSNLNGRRINKIEKRGFFKDPELSDRSNALLDILPVLATLVESNRPVVPVEMPPGNIDSFRVEVNDFSRKELKKEIFTEYRYQMSTRPQLPQSD